MTNPQPVLDGACRAIQTLLGDRPIAYHASLARALGSVTAGVLLSQLLYWAPRTSDPDGWFWKTRDDIYEETGLGRREQETARKVLRDAGVLLEQLKGVPARVHFRVHMDNLIALLNRYGNGGKPEQGSGSSQGSDAARPFSKLASSWAESAQLAGTVTPNKKVGIRPAIAETTAETTPEHHHDDVVNELLDFGVTAQAARRLVGEAVAAGKPPGYVSEKLAHVRFLLNAKSPLVRKNARGYLIRAIQDNYPAPPGYQSPAEVQAKRDERARRVQAAQAAIMAEHERDEQKRADEQRQRATLLATVRRRYPPAPILGTDLTTEAAWQMALQRLRKAVGRTDYAAWLSESILVACDGSLGIVAAQNRFAAQWLAARFGKTLGDELTAVLGFRVELSYQALADLATDQTISSTQPPASASAHAS